MLNEIFTVDNLLHSLVAVAFVQLGWLLVLRGRGHVWGFFLAAGLATVGLYLREASQVDWDWALRGSLHKHLEWIVGSVAGWLTAVASATVVNLTRR